MKCDFFCVKIWQCGAHVYIFAQNIALIWYFA